MFEVRSLTSTLLRAACSRHRLAYVGDDRARQTASRSCVRPAGRLRALFDACSVSVRFSAFTTRCASHLQPPPRSPAALALCAVLIAKHTRPLGPAAVAPAAHGRGYSQLAHHGSLQGRRASAATKRLAGSPPSAPRHARTPVAHWSSRPRTRNRSVLTHAVGLLRVVLSLTTRLCSTGCLI
jgi:hypothetical protein